MWGSTHKGTKEAKLKLAYSVTRNALGPLVYYNKSSVFFSWLWLVIKLHNSSQVDALRNALRRGVEEIKKGPSQERCAIYWCMH